MPHTRATRVGRDAAEGLAAVEQPFAVPARARTPFPWAIVASVSAGGVLGALARYGLGVVWPHPASGFPWTTFTINVTGCLLIGMLMVAVTDVWPSRRLLRPFLGTGVLGGYTTFSTYIVEAQQLMDARAAGVALAYVAATLIAALLAVYAGSALAKATFVRVREDKEQLS